MFTLFIFLMFFYWAMALYYSFKALTVKPDGSNAKQRFSQYASGIVLIVSGLSTAIVIVPSESQILQFMNQCGVINIYLITMSYLLAPSEDDEPQYSFDGHEVARTTSSGGSNNSLTDKQNEIQLTDLNNQQVPNEAPLENPHQMMTSIEMSDSD